MTQDSSTWIQKLIAFPAVYVLTLMWVIPDGSKYFLGIVLFVGTAVCIARFKHQRLALSSHNKLRIMNTGLWLFTMYCVFNYLTHGDSWNQLKSFLAVALYGLLASYLRTDKRYFYMVFLTSALSLTVLSWALYISGESRVGGWINPIPYATGLATLTTITFVIGMLETSKCWRYTFLAATLTLFSALLLTQTRGVIAPTIFTLLLLLFLTVPRALGWKKILATTLCAFAILMGSLIAVIPDRLERTAAELSAITQGQYNTSIGLRVIMWDAAIKVWKTSPFMGVGDKHLEVLEQLIKKNEVHQQFKNWKPSHYHNQFLNILAKKGAIGLTLFLALLAIALNVVLNQKEPMPRYAMLSTIIIYVSSSLSDVPFKQPETIALFFILLFTLPSLKLRSTNTPETS